MATTGDVVIQRVPSREGRFKLQVLDTGVTTSDNTEWIGVHGARDMSFMVLGFETPGNAKVQVRVHNKLTKPDATDNGFAVWTATADIHRYLAGPIEWIKMDLEEIIIGSATLDAIVIGRF